MPATEDHAPPSPSGSSSSDNSASTGPPQTPVTPGLPLTMPTFMNFTGEDGVTSLGGAAGVKRTSKTTRRINTAERRATHNAVERQRRETLNSRFLDLAALLSNLHQIRRPSKSAIVNSSIAHLTASRRHRALAAQQLRALKIEADALRREVNEWRARAGVAPAEEPPRSDAFGAVLRGELEFEAGDMLEPGAEEGEEDAAEAQYTDEEYALLRRQQLEREHAHAEMLARMQHQEQLLQQQQQQQPFVHPHPQYHAHAHARQPAHPHAPYYTPEPVIAAFDDPALAYEYEPHPHPELSARWAYEKQHMHALQQQQQQQQQQAPW
ncbi:hypothetical protein B0H15DRAFT_799142 [Mycena belliarum]|uniref:BHLH domain-containing protein n=1 Tax=Mycena belliarum TaxID=1033014 RepID=A0AAD6U8B8_9AGAR|nr:hypothetical protein B0H15DRAFT_799142 [Mycena belliae]